MTAWRVLEMVFWNLVVMVAVASLAAQSFEDCNGGPISNRMTY
jgi:hypothetical protein